MTIDEAIRHCEGVAERYDRVEDSHADDGLKQECIQCAADHRQLAEWLTELKQWRRVYGICPSYEMCIPECREGYNTQISEYKRLLKAAVEDMTGMSFGEECKVCSKKLLPNECPIHNNVACILEKDFKWRYADEAEKLLNDEK